MNPADLAEKLQSRIADTESLPIVVGFDAFVDEVIQVVDTRTSPDAYAPMRTIEEFGAWASASAGRSGLREFVTVESSAGGCSVNLGDGLAVLGFPVDAFAGVGIVPDPVFHDFGIKCRSLNPLGMEPGRSLVYEFQDGKLMLCSVSQLSKLSPDYLSQAILDGRYQTACEAAAGIVLTSWSVYPHMTANWRYLQKEVFSHLTSHPQFFLDLADPASRTPDDLIGMVSALSGFEKIGPTTLSLNGNEANRLAGVLGFKKATNESTDIERLASEIRDRTQIAEVGIHLISSATTATADGAMTVCGPYCPNPRKSVGAGDRFNAGYLAGGLLGLPVEERLLLAVAASGFFVRAARSGSLVEIIQFLRCWSEGTLDAPKT